MDRGKEPAPPISEEPDAAPINLGFHAAACASKALRSAILALAAPSKIKLPCPASAAALLPQPLPPGYIDFWAPIFRRRPKEVPIGEVEVDMGVIRSNEDFSLLMQHLSEAELRASLSTTKKLVFDRSSGEDDPLVVQDRHPVSLG